MTRHNNPSAYLDVRLVDNMGEMAIRVEALSKRYQIGPREHYKTVRETISTTVTAPFRRLSSALFSANGIRSQEKEDQTFWALQGVSFEVRRGEVLGIIGRNGAGKSTLLKMLSRITEPTRGRAEIHGRVGSLLEVGTGFHPELTGRENIYLSGSILGMKRAEIRRKFDEMVAFAEVEQFIDTPVKFYSSGMYVRLAFAVAAHLDPEVMLLDEVLAVGDLEFQKKCFGKMSAVARGGSTVLLVSHNMASIMNLCQRAILLQKGRLVADGPAPSVAQEYLATARSAGGEVTWPNPMEAPGTDTVRLQAVRIFQEGSNVPTADVDISKEVIIQITYRNLEEGVSLYSGLWLRDKMDTVVLSSSNAKSMSATEDAWYGRPHPVGVFQSVCRIPGNFLNDGLYSVTAIIGRGTNDTQVLEEYAVSFQVHDVGEMRKEYYGSWIGTVRPRLPWGTEYLGPAVGVVGVGR